MDESKAALIGGALTGALVGLKADVAAGGLTLGGGLLAGGLLGALGAAGLALAWAYVALRMAHAIVHLSYNRVTHLFIVFAASNGVLVAMLLRLAWRLK